MTEHDQTIRSLIHLAGGNKTVAERITADMDLKRPLQPSTVYIWTKSGIPEKYWGWVIQNLGLTPDQIYRMNQVARGGVTDMELGVTVTIEHDDIAKAIADYAQQHHGRPDIDFNPASVSITMKGAKAVATVSG